jgi:hypothetical protein
LVHRYVLSMKTEYELFIKISTGQNKDVSSASIRQQT